MSGPRGDSREPVARARWLLARRGGWIEPVPGGYALRIGADRRARVLHVIDETVFRLLIVRPGLKVRPGGGWTARPAAAAKPTPDPGLAPGRPGLIEGTRAVVGTDGRVGDRRANLGHSAVAWLARRRDARGQVWLTRAEVAAAERLGLEAEAALAGPSLTMRWDALPRSGGGSAARSEPGDRAMAAGRRLTAALAACGPARSLVEHVCLHATALQAAEQTLGLRRREGKRLLKQGLAALAAHYRLG